MTNSNSTEPHGIKFQPMPKQFMVWNKVDQRFSRNFDNDSEVFTVAELATYLSNRAYNGVNLDEYIILQSTNLFDKGSKEIFEGSLLQTDKEGVGYVYMEDNGQWNILFESSVHSLWDLLYAPNCKLVGHILSNPELVEEK